MTSAKEDCETLLNATFPHADQMLREHGEFFPYGGALAPSGEIVAVAGYDGRARPPSDDVIRLIKAAFVDGAKQGRYQATALIYDVRIAMPGAGEKSDAVAVSLNHRDDYSVTVIFPYTLSGEGPDFGPAFAQEGEADIFPQA